MLVATLQVNPCNSSADLKLSSSVVKSPRYVIPNSLWISSSPSNELNTLLNRALLPVISPFVPKSAMR